MALVTAQFRRNALEPPSPILLWKAISSQGPISGIKNSDSGVHCWHKMQWNSLNVLLGVLVLGKMQKKNIQDNRQGQAKQSKYFVTLNKFRNQSIVSLKENRE